MSPDLRDSEASDTDGIDIEAVPSDLGVPELFGTGALPAKTLTAAGAGPFAQFPRFPLHLRGAGNSAARVVRAELAQLALVRYPSALCALPTTPQQLGGAQ